jgi:hypothetical protein
MAFNSSHSPCSRFYPLWSDYESVASKRDTKAPNQSPRDLRQHAYWILLGNVVYIGLQNLQSLSAKHAMRGQSAGSLRPRQTSRLLTACLGDRGTHPDFAQSAFLEKKFSIHSLLQLSTRISRHLQRPGREYATILMGISIQTRSHFPAPFLGQSTPIRSRCLDGIISTYPIRASETF